jgi:hypothetical protein
MTRHHPEKRSRSAAVGAAPALSGHSFTIH